MAAESGNKRENVTRKGRLASQETPLKRLTISDEKRKKSPRHSDFPTKVPSSVELRLNL